MPEYQFSEKKYTYRGARETCKKEGGFVPKLRPAQYLKISARNVESYWVRPKGRTCAFIRSSVKEYTGKYFERFESKCNVIRKTMCGFWSEKCKKRLAVVKKKKEKKKSKRISYKTTQLRTEVKLVKEEKSS